MFYISYEEWMFNYPGGDGHWEEGFTKYLNKEDAEMDREYMLSSETFRNISEILIPMPKS